MGVFKLLINNQLNTKHWRIWLAFCVLMRLWASSSPIMVMPLIPLLLVSVKTEIPDCSSLWNSRSCWDHPARADLALAKQSGMPFGEPFSFPAFHFVYSGGFISVRLLSLLLICCDVSSAP